MKRLRDVIRTNLRGLVGLAVGLAVIAGLTAPAWAASPHRVGAARVSPRDTTVTGTDGTVTVTPSPITSTTVSTVTNTVTSTTTVAGIPITYTTTTVMPTTLTFTKTQSTTVIPPSTTSTGTTSGTASSGGTTTVTVPAVTTTVTGTGTTTPVPTTHQKKGASGYVASLMSWTFAYTPRYTEVSALHASNLVRRLYITLTCTGHGCPFTARTIPVKTSCRKVKGHERCTLPKTVDLTREFGTHHLAAKAQVSVMLRHKGWVGKYYRFTMRAAKTPAIVESCLAPNSTKPGVGCH